jgi:alpha-tubulin suppressor-like RCC1 family protein
MHRRAIRTGLLVGLMLPACHAPTEIVLVVDTNLAAVDLDEVTITVTGSAAGSPPSSFDVDLTADGAPKFPLTLGIEPSGSPGAIEVSVVGLFEGSPVVQQSARTAFVAGAQKMLRVLLLDTCIGAFCPGASPPQTCMAGTCQSPDVDGPSLPQWPGTPPARPAAPATIPIGGRTVWANGWHSCANEGSLLYCWGQNSDGEIGNNSTGNANARRQVMGIADLAAVGLGYLTSCACDRSGSAWCWGRNLEGELGIGHASDNSTVPVQVPGISDCVQIGGGGRHTCVVHGTDGSVSCWGGDSLGQVGQPTSAAGSCPQSTGPPVPCFTSPMLVPGLTGVADVRGGDQFTCARKTDLTVWCWGSNFAGELADGTATSRSTPAQIAELGNDVVELMAGRFHACARHQAGTVSCWGGGGSGQLGTGTTSNGRRPLAVVGITDATQLAGGFMHTCVLHTSGLVSCFGSNALGQLGNGTTSDSLSPVDVVGLKSITSIAAGIVHTCARAASGLAFCWGENIVNELGDGTTTNRSTPVSVAGFM